MRKGPKLATNWEKRHQCRKVILYALEMVLENQLCPEMRKTDTKQHAK